MLFLSLALAGLALAQEKAAPLAMLQAASCPADVGHEGHLLFKRVQLQAHSQTQAERKAAVEQAVHLGQQQKYVGGTPGDAGSYQEILLSHHNSYRAAHGAGPLSWNDQAAGFAQAMADTCVFEHSSPPRTFGENIAQGYLDFTSAVGAWYAEHPLYNGDRPLLAAGVEVHDERRVRIPPRLRAALLRVLPPGQCDGRLPLQCRRVGSLYFIRPLHAPLLSILFLLSQ